MKLHKPELFKVKKKKQPRSKGEMVQTVRGGFNKWCKENGIEIDKKTNPFRGPKNWCNFNRKG